jgi:hypothetical protein
MGRKLAFYHIFCRAGTPNLVQAQITNLIFSGCYGALDTIYCFLAGENQDSIDSVKRIVEKSGSKFVVAAEGPGDRSYERFTLLRMITMIEPDDKVLYFHSKSITKIENSNIQDWRMFLEFMTFTNHKEILELLDTYDTVGVNYGYYHSQYHYSGNFWWATGKYLLKLPKEIHNEYDAPEFWIALGEPKAFQLFNSKIDHYKGQYPMKEYVDIQLASEASHQSRLL